MGHKNSAYLIRLTEKMSSSWKTNYVFTQTNTLLLQVNFQLYKYLQGLCIKYGFILYDHKIIWNYTNLLIRIYYTNFKRTTVEKNYKLPLLHVKHEVLKIVQPIYPLFSYKNITILFHTNENIFTSAKLVALHIANSIEHHVTLQNVYKDLLNLLGDYEQILNKENTINKSANLKITGLKFRVAGRINGAELTQIETYKLGRIPTQTLTANIDFATYALLTIYGTFGIKVWLHFE